MDDKVLTTQVQEFLKKEFKKGDLIISYKESGIPGQMTPLFIRSIEKIPTISYNPLCINNLSVYLAELNLLELLENNNSGRVFLTIKPCDVNSVLQMISDAQIPREKVVIIVMECDGVMSVKDLKEFLKDDFSAIEIKGDTILVQTMQKGPITIKKEDFIASKCKEGSTCALPDTTDYYFIGTEKKLTKASRKNKILKDSTLVQDSLSKSDLKKLVESELSKCIRCNACRNICPACFCSDQCVMDKPKLVSPFIDKEVTPANNILYHLIRFYHVAPNCTACGECERVCPQTIKLSIFYKKLHTFTENELGYIPGKSDLERQKLLNYRFGEDLV